MTEDEMWSKHNAAVRRARLNVGSALVVVVLLSLGLWALIWLAASMALAHDQSDPFAEWMMSLKQPDNHVASCCGPADQYYAVEYREDPGVPGGFIVRTDEFSEPIHVPPEKVDWNSANPTGRGVIFLSKRWEGEVGRPGYVYCFEPGTGT